MEDGVSSRGSRWLVLGFCVVEIDGLLSKLGLQKLQLEGSTVQK